MLHIQVSYMFHPGEVSTYDNFCSHMLQVGFGVGSSFSRSNITYACCMSSPGSAKLASSGRRECLCIVHDL